MYWGACVLQVQASQHWRHGGRRPQPVLGNMVCLGSFAQQWDWWRLVHSYCFFWKKAWFFLLVSNGKISLLKRNIELMQCLVKTRLCFLWQGGVGFPASRGMHAITTFRFSICWRRVNVASQTEPLNWSVSCPVTVFRFTCVDDNCPTLNIIFVNLNIYYATLCNEVDEWLSWTKYHF